MINIIPEKYDLVVLLWITFQLKNEIRYLLCTVCDSGPAYGGISQAQDDIARYLIIRDLIMRSFASLRMTLSFVQDDKTPQNPDSIC
jgi:hypothetical protein